MTRRAKYVRLPLDDAFAEHWPLAQRVARGMSRRSGLPFDEIEQAARVGLWDALRRRPDAETGYLALRIRGVVVEYMRQMDRLKRRERARDKANGGKTIGFVSCDLLQELGVQFAAAHPDPSERIEEHERWRLVADAAEKLLPEDATALRWVAQGLSVSEAAQRMGVTSGRVSQRMSRVVSKLRRATAEA